MIKQPAICQRALAARPWAEQLTSRLPGLHPVADGDWLVRDDAFGPQMALRDRLFTEHRAAVFSETPGAEAAQRELFGLVVREVRASGAYGEEGGHLIRPDGIAVDATQPPPLVTAARLIQEDIAILAQVGDLHVLVAAAIAFPASWTLSEKIGRPLAGIHQPVSRITPEMDQRIERIFARLPSDRPVQRANALAYNDPSLHQPRGEAEPRSYDPAAASFIRVERQTLRRLPASNTIAFTIHTSQVPFAQLTAEEAQDLCRYLVSIGATPPANPFG